MNIKAQNSLDPEKKISAKKLLVLDTSYSLEAIVTRGLQESVTCRDLDGFFEHVWTVHPFATLVTSEKWTPRYGKFQSHQLAPRHTFIEGKIGRYSFLKWLFPVNFLLGQASLFFYLLRLIRKEKITVIRAGDMLYLGLLAWILSKFARIPFLVRVGGNHDKIFETTGQPIQKRLFFSRKIEKKIERFVFKRAHLVAGANKDNLNFALANGARTEWSTIFRYGNLIHKLHFIDPTERGDDNLLKEIGLEKKKFLIYIGRLEKVKHPDDVIRVLADTRAAGHDLKAALVGDGRMLQELELLSRELNVRDHVIFCGNRPQEWLANVIPLAAAVVSPHTGRALSEAALAGVPVVAYDVDWQAEMIETAVTGELVPHTQWKQMASSVIKFLENPEYARSMGTAVRQRAIKMMWPATLDQHERHEYEKLFTRYYGQREALLYATPQ